MSVYCWLQDSLPEGWGYDDSFVSLESVYAGDASYLNTAEVRELLNTKPFTTKEAAQVLRICGRACMDKGEVRQLKNKLKEYVANGGEMMLACE